MTTEVLAAAGGTGSQIAFWIFAPVAVIAALGMVFSRNAVHGALLLVVNFFCVAVFYVLLQAPFLAAVQVIVYTGAIMILFLFVLMLVGVDSSDSLVETLRGQRLVTAVAAIGFAGLMVSLLVQAVGGQTPVGAGTASDASGGNVTGIALLLFTRYVMAFEVTSALLITAALGAMVLATSDTAAPKRTQKEQSIARFAGGHPVPMPGPGVYALSNSADTPARLPDGSLSADSVLASEARAPLVRSGRGLAGSDRAVGGTLVDDAEGQPERAGAATVGSVDEQRTAVNTDTTHDGEAR